MQGHRLSLFYPPSLAGEAEFYDEFWALENPNIHRPKGVMRDDWKYALDRIQPNERLLDVGCAEGAFLEHASKVAIAEGIDENDEGCRLARSSGLKATCASVTDFAQWHPEAFDAVVASQVLEHVYDVATFMNGLIRLVRPGGRLVLSVPNNEPYYVGWTKYDPLNNPPHHIGMWNEASLRKMARHFDLAVDEVGHLGAPDRFTLQVYRRAAYLADVTKAPNQLDWKSWLRIGLAAPIALVLTLKERVLGSTSNHAYVSVVLRKPIR